MIYSVDFDFAAKSLGKVATLDAETICRLRTAIADQLLNNELIADSKNPYLRHLKAVRESGCENAYNHYVALYGDQPAFKRWVALHPIEWQRFADWFDSYNPADGECAYF